MSLYQTLVLLLFNEGDNYSLEEIRQATNIGNTRVKEGSYRGQRGQREVKKRGVNVIIDPKHFF